MTDGGRILAVDDERSMRDLLEVILGREGWDVTTAASGEEALELLDASPRDLVLTDVRMGDMDGIEVLRRVKERDPLLPVLVMTAFSTWEKAVEAMRLGAYAYIRKPFDNDGLRDTVARALERAAIVRAQGEDSAERSLGGVGGAGVVGQSDAIRTVLDITARVAPTDTTVLITGESGTGKELVARALHRGSPRAGGAFLTVNCGAFPANLMESELFGHVRGAFTGAVADKQGLVETADGGTLLLDEVGELEPAIQAKLLHVLEDGRYLPVGAVEPRRADVRFIGATNRDLEAEVEAGRFRGDLFYRLNVIPIEVPPLRERREDIPLLAGHFLRTYAERMDRPFEGFTEDALRVLHDHSWPGNVRELANAVQRAVALGSPPDVTVEDLDPSVRGSAAGARPAPDDLTLPPGGLDLEDRLLEVEVAYIRAALARTEGNMTRAAELLGMTFRAMRYKVKKLGIDPDACAEGSHGDSGGGKGHGD